MSSVFFIIKRVAEKRPNASFAKHFTTFFNKLESLIVRLYLLYHTKIDLKIVFWCGKAGNFFGFLRDRNSISAPLPMECKSVFPDLKKILHFKKTFLEDWDFNSVTTHTSYMVTIYHHCILFLLHCLMAKVCVIDILFLLTKMP